MSRDPETREEREKEAGSTEGGNTSALIGSSSSPPFLSLLLPPRSLHYIQPQSPLASTPFLPCNVCGEVYEENGLCKGCLMLTYCFQVPGAPASGLDQHKFLYKSVLKACAICGKQEGLQTCAWCLHRKYCCGENKRRGGRTLYIPSPQVLNWGQNTNPFEKSTRNSEYRAKRNPEKLVEAFVEYCMKDKPTKGFEETTAMFWDTAVITKALCGEVKHYFCA
jgi:hypothetical protein